MTLLPADADALQRRFDLLEAAAREAILHSKGALCVRVASLCDTCGAWDEAVWFHSRGWVCLTCEDGISGVGTAPTPEQRRVGGVTDATWAVFRKHVLGK